MQRDLVLIALLYTLLFINTQHVEAKICSSIDVRNNPTSLEKLRNCSIIVGDLYMVLMDGVVESGAYDNYTFPELTEIVDYMIVFKISQLISLRNLFPNLKIIRGRKLFHGFSLVIYGVPHLEEIGLTNLQHIGRGKVKVDHCPNACYVTTVDWKRLGAEMLDYPPAYVADCKHHFCKNECGGHCWNHNTCQKQDTDYCKEYEDEGKCVSRCPVSKVVNHASRKCWTRKECESIKDVDGNYWVFNGTCINACPIFYEHDINVEGGCRYVGKQAYIKECFGGDVTTLDQLEYFEGCTYVNGYLRIHISSNALEQRLEECLGNIVTITEFLKIGRSKAISSLEFLKNLTTIKGEKLDNKKYALFVYENANLRRLWNFTKDFKLTIHNGTMAFHDNPQLCLSEIKKLENATKSNSKIDNEISLVSNGYKSNCKQKNMNVTISETNPTNVTISWKISSETVIGYTIYYIFVGAKNITFYDEKNACDADSWDGIFIRENKIQLSGLLPFTRYAYYIKIYTTGELAEQTSVNYFTTAPTEPSKPNNLIAEALNESSIILKWNPPYYLNGILGYYMIYLFSEETYLPTIQQRNYCKNPLVEVNDKHLRLTSTVSNATKTDNCSCANERDFVRFILEDLVCPYGEFDMCVTTTYQQEAHFPTGTSLPISHKFKVPANETSFVVKDLKHFSLYVFYLSACNLNYNESKCGPSVMIAQKTNKKENVDTIKALDVGIQNKDVKITWFEPQEFNSALVGYQIEYKRTDSEHSKPRIECITEEEYRNLGRAYHILELSPGKYAVHVQALSLAGAGNFSEWNYFEIGTESTSVFTIVGPIILFIMLALIGIIGYYWHKRKQISDNIHLITSINPDYAGPIYVEDEWEIERNDIEIIKELGQGSFGMVHQGIIKSRRFPCAIKTVNESASMFSRMEFLNEGSVMKTFNDAHHVIKLLGIVSRGQPPLVVMELMERGDLKSYLRRCREPSQNLTTNELYRMAAEIADGMAYLTAKKFVHRDLAARNCMVGADRTVKIGDFGMARDIYETDYYRKETVGLLPVRWMAPESLADGVFTSDSDVWSYGIVLWEMATLAEQPYQGLSNEEVFHFVKSKGKLDRPTECSDLLYEVMDACWMWRPNDRPTFSGIVNKLVNHVGEDFKLVAFCFSRQGQELALNAGPRVYNPPAMLPASEDDYFGHYDRSEEEVNLCVKNSNRPAKFLPFSNQRRDKSESYQISPGSPSSTFSFDSS